MFKRTDLELRNLEDLEAVGGFWKGLVRSVKNCLKPTIGKSILNFDEIRTFWQNAS